MRNSLTLSCAAVAVLLAGTAYAQSDGAQSDGAQSGNVPSDARQKPRGETTRVEAEQRSAAAFGRMDANQDGVLDQVDREAARRQAFDRIDADKDGTISFAEYEARRDGRGEARAERRGPRDRGFARRGGPGGPRMARAADADRDGAVTQAEFTTAALARFDRADANSDGTISAEERRDRRHWRHDRRRGRPAGDAG